jgi:hypothetical protein
MTTPTDAQLKTIAEKIFVTGDLASTRLAKPATSGPAAFKTALDAIGSQPEFKDAGLAVIDFTRSASSPDVWLRNGDLSYRIGSASKIAVMLAAVQLRMEVRRIHDLKIVTTPAEFDALFANRQLWAKGKSNRTGLLDIAASAPLISEIFDFTKSPIDFAGPDPDGQTSAAKQKTIVDKLTDGHLAWRNWSDLKFSERYWLCGCLSDNVAAATCVSQVGVPYVKAVLRAYGLAEPARGMHFLATATYDNIPARAAPGAVAPPRQLVGQEMLPVLDAWVDGKGGFTDKRSVVPASAAALAAYMIGLMTDTLVNDGSVAFGLTGCKTLRNNLADGGAEAVQSFLVAGVGNVADTAIKKEVNKIGILKKSDGAKAPILCEFVYLETQQVPKPPAPRRETMKYAVIAVGLIDELDATPPGTGAVRKAKMLGEAVHKALLAL